MVQKIWEQILENGLQAKIGQTPKLSIRGRVTKEEEGNLLVQSHKCIKSLQLP